MQFEQKKIFDYIDAHREDYIALLSRMCGQKSLAMTGEGIGEMFRIVTGTFREYGLEMQAFETPGNPCVLAVKKGETEITDGGSKIWNEKQN